MSGRRALLCISLAFVCLPGLAQEETRSKPCGDYDTQNEMNACAADKASNADKRLNALYTQLLDKLQKSPDTRARVVAAERAWIASRDADLVATWPISMSQDTLTAYGSVHPFCYYSTLESMIEDRIKVLKSWLSTQEGDVCGSSLVACSHPASNAASGD
jgi:uncharacterized protein YecT (DUF1311 family)